MIKFEKILVLKIGTFVVIVRILKDADGKNEFCQMMKLILVEIIFQWYRAENVLTVELVLVDHQI